MLENLLDRDYDVNLQVTAILSRVAMLPHPYVHEYLINPTIPISGGGGSAVRTLHSVLTKVIDQVRRETEGMAELRRKIYVCRKTLMGKG